MGLIKAAAGAIGSTLKDQWKEAVRCEDMNNEILMVKKTTPTGVITNKSTIIVAPGQCAIIYDNGRVLDATAEEGVYEFDTSSSPSFFAGQFGATFKEMWQRFTYNGATAKEQAVFFFNTKEILDNKFGTAAPIPFQDWSHPIPNQMTNTVTPLRVQIKCFGKYTFRINNPAVFMEELAGTANIYTKDKVVEQMRAEVIAVFQNIVNELGTEKYKVPVLAMPSQTDEIRTMMNEMVFDEPVRRRGLSIVTFAVESVTLDEESAKKIDQYELSSNAHMQQGRLVDAYADAVQSAAENKSGSMNGFMGIGMMNMATNGMVGGAASGPWNAQNVQNSTMDLSKTTESKPEVTGAATLEEKLSTDEWICECGAKNNGKFCSNCGKPKIDKKICPNCKKVNENTDKFCNECGTKLD
ncbi:MAG: SPFH domain-containing protein [Clostridia bacterium]|nr:SPFH domain-containing protein [Clostridia bacterium]